MARRFLTPPAIVPIVTTLPTSPVDGQVCHFLADAANGVVWALRYRAASASAYKWEVIEGAPLFAEVVTEETAPSGGYVALATAGPAVTLPLSSDYDVDIGATASSPGANAQFWMGHDVGATLAVDADAAFGQVGASGANTYHAIFRPKRKTGLTAGQAVTCKYRGGGAAGAFGRRFLRVRPVRVG